MVTAARQLFLGTKLNDKPRQLKTRDVTLPKNVHIVKASVHKVKAIKMEAEDEIDSITESMDMNLSKLWKIVKDRAAWCAAVHGVTNI